MHSEPANSALSAFSPFTLHLSLESVPNHGGAQIPPKTPRNPLIPINLTVFIFAILSAIGHFFQQFRTINPPCSAVRRVKRYSVGAVARRRTMFRAAILSLLLVAPLAAQNRPLDVQATDGWIDT